MSEIPSLPSPDKKAKPFNIPAAVLTIVGGVAFMVASAASLRLQSSNEKNDGSVPHDEEKCIAVLSYQPDSNPACILYRRTLSDGTCRTVLFDLSKNGVQPEGQITCEDERLQVNSDTCDCITR